MAEESRQVDKEKAWHMAHAGKEYQDKAAEVKSDLDRLKEKKGPLAFIKRKLLQGRVRHYETSARSREEFVDESIEKFRTMKWYALTKRLYNETIERANKMGDQKLATALEHDRDLSAVEAWEQSLDSSRPLLARMVEAVALVGSDFSGNAERTFTLAGNRVPMDWNPLKAASGYDQGEEATRVNLDIVRKAYDLFGLEGKEKIPNSLPRKGHFEIGAPDMFLKGIRLPDNVLGVSIPEDKRKLTEDKSIKRVSEDIEDFPVNFRFEYYPERTRSGAGEEPPIYIPEHIEVRISNTRKRSS